jgi:serine/threonine-protein kinase
MRLLSGQVLDGRYAIERVLGDGVSGTVYAATRARDDVRVALKVIHPHLLGDRQILGRFRREAAILKTLRGEHLVKLLDVIEGEGLLAIVLEYVDGRSLDRVLAERGPLTLSEAVDLMGQIASALGAAHAAGVVHRDLKPANVLVTTPRSKHGRLEARVVDFGLAKVLHGDKLTTGLTEQDMIFGTAEYMSPEQVRGDDVDARCDVYAAGVILYELLTGEVPFAGRTPVATMSAQLFEPPRPPRLVAPTRRISPGLEAVVLRALAKDRELRYASATAFAEALSTAQAEDSRAAIADAHESVASLATCDTDLHVRVSGLGLAATSPDGPRKAEARGRAPHRERWGWILTAAAMAAAAIAFGVLFGAR